MQDEIRAVEGDRYRGTLGGSWMAGGVWQKNLWHYLAQRVFHSCSSVVNVDGNSVRPISCFR